MTASQLPGQTLEPIPVNPSAVNDTRWTCLQKIVELSRQWAVQRGASGATGDSMDDEFTLWQKFNRNLYNISPS